KWVLGLEGGAGWSNAHGARPCPGGFFYTCETDVSWLTTGTARIGYTPWDRLLVYVKGGAALGRDRAEVTCTTGAQPTVVPLAGCPAQSDAGVRAGWTVGWGSEFGLTRNLSLNGEIKYFNLGTAHRSIAGSPADVDLDGFASTVGLRFRF